MLQDKLKIKQKRTDCGCQRWGVGEMGKRNQKVQTYGYKINKSWEYNI